MRPICAAAIRTLTLDTTQASVYLVELLLCTAGTYNTRSSTAKSIHLPASSYSTLFPWPCPPVGPFGSCPVSFPPTRLLLPSDSSLFPLSLNMQIDSLSKEHFLVSLAGYSHLFCAGTMVVSATCSALSSFVQHAPTYPLPISTLVFLPHAAVLGVRPGPARV